MFQVSFGDYRKMKQKNNIIHHTQNHTLFLLVIKLSFTFTTIFRVRKYSSITCIKQPPCTPNLLDSIFPAHLRIPLSPYTRGYRSCQGEELHAFDLTPQIQLRPNQLTLPTEIDPWSQAEWSQLIWKAEAQIHLCVGIEKVVSKNGEFLIII